MNVINSSLTEPVSPQPPYRVGIDACPSCGSTKTTIFYELDDVPTNSCLLIDTVEEALDCLKGDIRLTYCKTCGFIYNAAFLPSLTEYSDRYEDTQGFSPFFNRFHLRLAQDLVERYGLRSRDVVEIGCGKGDFLVILAKLGGNRCVGIDPSAEIDRLEGIEGAELVTLLPTFFGPQHSLSNPDFVCCKMTLEHISETAKFVQNIRDGLSDEKDTTVFFQIPDAGRILDQCAAEDIYYEHCSYFTEASLRHLFESCGFAIKRTAIEYDGQYLTIEAVPAKQTKNTVTASRLEEQEALIATFSARARSKNEYWRSKIEKVKAAGKPVVIWGSGSKAVSFLHSAGTSEHVDFVTDINPNRHGHFMPGTGQPIVPPDVLAEIGPGLIIVMNRNYEAEIVEQLEAIGVHCEIASL